MISTALRRTGASGAVVPFNVAWHSAFWAGDPNWSNPGNGNTVTSWTDGSGNGHTATVSNTYRNAIDTIGPIYRSSNTNLNNQPAVDFTTEYMALATAKFTTVTQTNSWVAVVDGRFAAGQDKARLFDNYGVSGSTARQFSSPNNAVSGLGFMYAGTLAQPSITHLTGGLAFRLKFSGSSSLITRNGSTIASSVNTGTGGVDAIQMSENYEGDSTTWFNGAIGFFGLYAGDVTADPNWSAFVSWVSTTYGLTIA